MTLKTKLMAHQVAGVEKLLPLKIGALYMEMGTGKTRTALEIVYRRANKGKLDRVIWLCPCSVQSNLKADLDKHSDGWREIIQVHGIESLSSSVRLYSELLEAVTSKTMLIVDESNLVKNGLAIRSKRIVALAESCKYRMILNGTPISRNEADLFNQWYLLDWRVLGYQSYYAFAANHVEYDETTHRIRRTLNTDYLVEKIAPYSYQVKRAECFELPDKKYGEWHWNMTCKQEAEYSRVADVLMMAVDELQPSTIYRMFSGLQAVISGQYVNVDTLHFTTSPMFSRIDDNPHIDSLRDLINARIGAEKAIIFCKYTHEINEVMELLNCEYGSDSAVSMFGEDNLKKRQANIERFRATAQFLVANKTCAGYGLNLQFCHNVIYYSNDWDYATRIQSEDRVHRLGQAEQVYIYDMICNDSLDVRIVACLQRKEMLLDSIKAELKSAGAEDRQAALRSFVFGKRKKRGAINDGESLRDTECV